MAYLAKTLTLRESGSTGPDVTIRLEPDCRDESDNPAIRWEVELKEPGKPATKAHLDLRIDDAHELAEWLLHAIYGRERVTVEIAPQDDEASEEEGEA